MTRVAILSLLLFASPLAAFAQTPKPDDLQILLATQLGLVPGETTKLTLRGMKLDGATEVLASSDKAQIKLLNKGGANVPQKQEANRVGNTQVEIEITLPADFPPGMLELRVKTGAGETKPYAIEVGGPHAVVSDKEGNDGFKQAQPIALPQIVLGSIQGNQDVDVFVIDAQAGQKLSAETIADRHGSGLDAFLAVYDANGRVVKLADDLPNTRDARVEWTTSTAGKYFIVVSDSLDLGGPAHAYRLIVAPVP